MLKQLPSRNQRTKGFKVKHVLKICLLLAICIWLLNQVKQSYEKYKVYGGTEGGISGKIETELEAVKLGRKDIHSRAEGVISNAENEEDKAELDDDGEDGKLAEDSEDGGRGGGDDEIDGHDQERAEEEESEEVEDLVDVDDRGSEEQQDSQGKVINLPEDGSSIDGLQNEGKRSIQELREEHYKGDNASNSVVNKLETMNSAENESSNSADS